MPFGSSSKSDLMAGSSIARARPRSHTPTSFSSNYAEMPADGFATLPRAEPAQSPLTAFNKFDALFPSAFTSSPVKATTPPPKTKVPIAMAIHELVHVWFKTPDAANAEVRAFGTLMVSFPSSFAAQLADTASDHTTLKFSLQNAEQLKAIVPNKKLILPTPLPTAPASAYKFTLDRLALANWLLEQKRAQPALAFYNTEIIRYELVDGFLPPLYVQSYWKLDASQTDIRIDYRLNTEESAVKNALLNISFSTEVSGGAQLFNSDPAAKW